MNTPNSASAAASAASGIASASAASATLGAQTLPALYLPCLIPSLPLYLSIDALDQVVHLLEQRLGLLVGGARRDDFLAGVVLERALEDRVGALLHLGQHGVGLLAPGLGHGLAVGRHLDVALLESAAHEVLHGLAFEGRADVVGVDRQPVPLRAGEVTLRRERRLVDVIAANVDAAALGRLDHDLGTVDVAGDHVDALVDQAVRRLGLLHRKRPVARDDHLAGDLRIDAPRAQGEGVDVAQHLRNGLRGDEADFLGLAGVARRDAVDVLALVDVAEVAAGVHRMLVL